MRPGRSFLASHFDIVLWHGPAQEEWALSMAHPELSERELQVLRSMALGRSNKEIGQVLFISENTVKGHVKSILTKLDAIGRTEAIAILIGVGLYK
jgi:DNA-binding CsgD family transcriptional regulator